MTEEWRELEWGPYLVSSDGRVASLRLANPDWKHGYVQCSVVPYGLKPQHKYVHQLVAEGFLGPCPKGCEVHHRNEDKSDNRPQNLEYVTRKDHILITTQKGQHPRGERHGRSKLTEDQVREIRRRHTKGGKLTWPMLAEEYGVSKGAIQGILERRTWRHIE